MISAIRSHPDIIPALRASVSIVLTSLIVKNFVDRVLGNQNPYHHILSTGTSVVLFEGLHPASNRALGILATTYLVIEVVKWMFQPSPPKQDPAPKVPVTPKWLFPLKNDYMESVTPETFLAMDKLLKMEDQVVLVNARQGWDIEFLCWMIGIRDHHVFFYNFDGKIDNLKSCLSKNPSTTIFSGSKIEGLVLPPEAKLFVYGNEGVELPNMSRDEMISFMKRWIFSNTFRKYYPHLLFEGKALDVLYDHYPQRSLYSWIRAISQIIGRGKYKLIHSLADRRLLFVYSELQVDTARQTIVEKLQALGLTCCSHHASTMYMPSFLSHIPSIPPHPARAAQLKQLQAASGEDAPHTVIIGAKYTEVELLLSQMGRLVFKFDYDKYKEQAARPAALVEFLTIYPEAILYDLTLEGSNLLSNSKLPNVTVIGQLSTLQLKEYMDRAFMDKYKTVQLTPLTKEECHTEIHQWAEKRQIKFTNQALEIAIAASFLLHEANGSEYSFAIDIVERAAKSSKEITPQNIWETFIPMYNLHLATQQEVNKLNVNPTQCISLVRISMALKKEFDILLPVKKVKLTQPPEFLTDLNEKMKDSKEALVEIPERMEMLEDALVGQYTNALIVGEAGTGKTALVKLMAALSARGELPEKHPLYGKTIYDLSHTGFTRDTKHLGEQQTKIDDLFNFLMQAKNAVLFVDEIHAVMGEGSHSGNLAGNIANYMKKYLEESGICVIGATTTKEYKKWVEDDDAFVRRFNKVALGDPTETQLMDILTKYSTSEIIKGICPTLVFTDENFKQILEDVKRVKKDVSIVDRSKKQMEAVAKYAKRNKLDKLTPEVMRQVAPSVL